MISKVSRILAYLLVVSFGVTWFLKMDSMVSLEKQLSQKREILSTRKINFEKDSNNSKQEISALFKERSSIRNRLEEVEAEAEKLERQIVFAKIQSEEFEKKLGEASGKSIKLKAELKQAKSPLDDLLSKSSPLINGTRKLEDQIAAVKEKVLQQKKSTESLEGDLSALMEKRKVQREAYDNQRNELLAEIELPAELYYGFEMDVKVSNRAPSGKGVFVEKGFNDGIRKDMLFLSTRAGVTDPYPFYLTSNFVDDDLTFLTFANPEEMLDLNVDEKLFLIRTKDSNTSE